MVLCNNTIMTAHIDTIVSIPTVTLAAVDLRLWDPLRNKIHYGSRSALIVGLLREWLEKEEEGDGDGEGSALLAPHTPVEEAANGH